MSRLLILTITMVFGWGCALRGHTQAPALSLFAIDSVDTVDSSSESTVHLPGAPEVGQCLPIALENIIFVVHRGGDFCAASFEHHGITYSVDIDCATERVVFVETRDVRFRTPDGVGPGSSLAEALHAKGAVRDGDPCVPHSGHPYFDVLLPSGWVLQFSTNAVCSGQPSAAALQASKHEE